MVPINGEAEDLEILCPPKNRAIKPDAKIAILTGCLPNYLPLGIHTIYTNKMHYCLRHGYHLEIVSSIREKYRDSKSHASGFSWSRLEHLLDMVEAARHEWVWTVGCDTLITNFTIPIERIINLSQTPEAERAPLPICPPFPDSPAPPKVIHWKAPPGHITTGKKHLLICGERVTSMQADSFIIRCSPEGAAYLRDILSHYEEYKYHVWVENQAMIDLRDKHAAITFQVPQWMLNSVDYSRWYGLRPQYRTNTDCYGNRGNWVRGDLLMHWPAATLDERLEWLRLYTPEIVY